MTVENEFITDCMPSFAAELRRIDFESVLVLLSDGEPLSIHQIDSEFARSVLTRMEANTE